MSNLLDALLPGSKATKAIEVLPKLEPEVVKAKETKPDTKYVSMAVECGNKLAESGRLQAQADALKKEVNKVIKALYEAKVTIGRKGQCAMATAFHDVLTENKLAKGTVSNYLSVFREAVNSGIEVEDWNTSRKKEQDVEIPEETDKETKSKVIVSKPKTEAEKQADFATRLKAVFNVDDGERFKALCMKIEAKYQADEYDCLYAGFIDFLESEGI